MQMTTIITILGFAVTFTAVFGLSVAVARKRAAALEARRELLAEEEHKRQVMQAKSDDMWRANKHLGMR